MWFFTFDTLINNINKYIAAIGEVVIFALMFAAVWFTGQTHTQFIARVFARTSLLCMPLSVAIIYLFASNKGIISKICTNKIIVYIGNISAYTFLIHQIAIRYVSGTASLINKEINQWVIAVVSFAVTIIGSIIFMKIEKKVKKAS